MARRPTDPDRKYRLRVDGDLAIDPAYEERRRQYEREQERQREHEEFIRPPQRKPRQATQPRRRERGHVALGTLVGVVALAAMVALLISCRAQLTALSADVVSMQKELSTLEEENVKLLSKYENTFDLTTVKEAAAAAGMNKPSASQVYYIDLSEPDSVVVYGRQSTSVLADALASLRAGADAMVEYFK